MCRFLVICLMLGVFISCSKDDDTSLPPVTIPDILNGTVTELDLTPADINTPDKASFFISANNTIYKVDFNVTDQAEANATLIFGTDTILTAQSREVGNLERDVVAYSPVAANEILILFKDGKKVDGLFNAYTVVGGVFGVDVINQWREPNDPAKPNQKAKDDIMHLIQLYNDKDGAGPGTAPQYLFVKVSKV